MEALVMTLMLWLSSHSDLNWKVPLPFIEQVSHEELLKIGKGDIPGTVLLAVYDHEKRIIYLSSRFDPENFDHRGILVHELLHHIQNVNKVWYRNCISEYEVEAYRVHNLWYTEHGRPPLNPPGFAILMSVCPSEKD